MAAEDFQARLAAAGTFQTFQIDVRELKRASENYILEQPKLVQALTRAVNWTAQKGWTQARGELAKAMGLPQGELRPYIYTQRASFTNITWQAVGTGAPITLRAFSAVQRKRGVSARPWGQRRIFRGSFIIESLGGSVYHREGPKVLMRKGRYKGKYRQAIKKMYGPAVPKVMMEEVVTRAFGRVAATDLPARIDHEIAYALRSIGPR